jgi:hypothetical protein
VMPHLPKCDTCGFALVVTDTGFMCCPNGHGRLIQIPMAIHLGGGLYRLVSPEDEGMGDRFRRCNTVLGDSNGVGPRVFAKLSTGGCNWRADEYIECPKKQRKRAAKKNASEGK